MAPYLPVAAGTEIRGWLALTDSSALQVVWDAPQAAGRLVTSFLAHAYPAAIVQRMVRKPGVATFIQLHTPTAAMRSLCYSPPLREHLQKLFYPSTVTVMDLSRVGEAGL